jgi:hypothetical protein
LPATATATFTVAVAAVRAVVAAAAMVRAGMVVEDGTLPWVTLAAVVPMAYAAAGTASAAGVTSSDLKGFQASPR